MTTDRSRNDSYQEAIVSEFAREQPAQLAVPARVGLDADAGRKRTALGCVALSDLHQPSDSLFHTHYSSQEAESPEKCVT